MISELFSETFAHQVGSAKIYQCKLSIIQNLTCDWLHKIPCT